MISLTLCMIVKNEEAVLERILSPVSEIVDEILIADTGSSDRTKELAGQYTSLVFDFPWCNDFSAARNFLVEKVHTDYWMWLDADDILNEENLEKLKLLKASLDKKVDVVMMDYAAGFDADKKVIFSYYRERILKTSGNFRWSGRVHEAIMPKGNIFYSDIEIQHRKYGQGDPDRNLRIYEKMLAENEPLEPRHQLYYGRELFYHQKYQETADVLEAFLYSLTLDIPRAEICCEIGKIFLERSWYRQAAYWYGQALTASSEKKKGGFFMTECHGFVPYMQLCVCYDRMGCHEQAFFFHKKAEEEKPNDPKVKYNANYFKEKYGWE